MNNKVLFMDWGCVPYKEAWDRQETLFRELVQLKNSDHATQDDTANYLIFCEHPHVFTLGKSGDKQNLLLSPEQLAQEQASFVRTNRGGDITYHGPGQIVGYPIINLENFSMGIKTYIEALEDVIILSLEKLGIIAGRLAGATGVWLEPETQRARKICAIGVKASRYISMHGFALNVNTDLRYFSFIHPCGFTDKGVTSIEKELGAPYSIPGFKELLCKNFEAVFGMELLFTSTD